MKFDTSDKRFLGLLVCIAGIVVIAILHSAVGVVLGIMLLGGGLLTLGQGRPQTERSHTAYKKHDTPLEESHHGNLTGDDNERRAA